VKGEGVAERRHFPMLGIFADFYCCHRERILDPQHIDFAARSNLHLKCPQWLKERLLKQLFRFFETYPSFADIRGSIAPTPVINGSFDDIILVHGNPLLI
jgi:hypothetical protein